MPMEPINATIIRIHIESTASGVEFVVIFFKNSRCCKQRFVNHPQSALVPSLYSVLPSLDP